MDFLYSLYDALVSINVPGDKARAVVDAMERDMGMTLATKTDLLLLKQDIAAVRNELKQDIAAVRNELKQDIAAVRQELKQDMALMQQQLKQDIASVRQDLAQDIALVRKDMEILRNSMTVRLASMFFLGLGLLFAALRLT